MGRLSAIGAGACIYEHGTATVFASLNSVRNKVHSLVVVQCLQFLYGRVYACAKWVAVYVIFVTVVAGGAKWTAAIW